MSKINLIIKREYSTRVRKKSFIVMTILGPILMAALFIVPIFLAHMTSEKKVIQVVDETGLFGKIKNSESVEFKFLSISFTEAEGKLAGSKENGLLYIPMNTINAPSMVRLVSEKELGIDVKTYIESQMKTILRNYIYETEGLKTEHLEEIDKKSDVAVTTAIMKEDGKTEESSTELSMVLGMFGGILIYFMIFMFGSQIMRGVIEEKTSRIVEIIVSSVKPFQLLMGKIIGVGLVGLTQFLLWIVFTFAIITVFKTTFPEKFKIKQTEQVSPQNSKMLSAKEITVQNQFGSNDDGVNKVLKAFKRYNFVQIILCFLFYFVGGFLIYGTLFAAIGSAVDSESDTQQFMLPITIPLIFSIVMAQYIIMNPQGSLSFWLSVIPLTSPIVMMIRLPFGVPVFDLVISMSFMVGAFLFNTWLAGKIYRTGILMYGKKVTYRELYKWLKYK